MFDYHIHSYHSSDSKMNFQTACDQAIKQGLREVAFTDHMDFDWPSDENFEIKNMDEYIRDINIAKEMYKDKLSVKLGIEMGMQPHTLKQSRQIAQCYPFDYIIASLHLVNREDVYYSDYYKKRDKIKSYTDYYQEMHEQLLSYEDFSTIGHFDYIRRYTTYPYEPEDAYIGMDIIDEILKLLIHKGKGLEVNTSGYSHQSCETLPHFNVIKRFKELGGEIITLGSDAHTPEFVGYEWKRGLEAVKSAGFPYLASFTRLQPTFIRI